MCKGKFCVQKSNKTLEINVSTFLESRILLLVIKAENILSFHYGEMESKIYNYKLGKLHLPIITKEICLLNRSFRRIIV